MFCVKPPDLGCNRVSYRGSTGISPHPEIYDVTVASTGIQHNNNLTILVLKYLHNFIKFSGCTDAYMSLLNASTFPPRKISVHKLHRINCITFTVHVGVCMSNSLGWLLRARTLSLFTRALLTVFVSGLLFNIRSMRCGS